MGRIFVLRVLSEDVIYDVARTLPDTSSLWDGVDVPIPTFALLPRMTVLD